MRKTYVQLFHLITGVLIAVLLGIHMVIMHLDNILAFFGAGDLDPTSWVSMIARSGQGLWIGVYIALLAVVLYHGLNGLRGIILEVTSSASTGRILTWVIIAFGAIAFVWGSYVPVALWTG
jgi:succinate dehydrogenase / fumarate reductase membrane anchor subunit